VILNIILFIVDQEVDDTKEIIALHTLFVWFENRFEFNVAF
jgi:hypothetical protein